MIIIMISYILSKNIFKPFRQVRGTRFEEEKSTKMNVWETQYVYPGVRCSRARTTSLLVQISLYVYVCWCINSYSSTYFAANYVVRKMFLFAFLFLPKFLERSYQQYTPAILFSRQFSQYCGTPELVQSHVKYNISDDNYIGQVILKLQVLSHAHPLEN